jgi:hypothetical protein
MGISEGISQPALHVGHVGSCATVGDDSHCVSSTPLRDVLDVDMASSINGHTELRRDLVRHQSIYCIRIELFVVSGTLPRRLMRNLASREARQPGPTYPGGGCMTPASVDEARSGCVVLTDPRDMTAIPARAYHSDGDPCDKPVYGSQSIQRDRLCAGNRS